MTLRPSSYPHPVMGLNDDVAGEFFCELPVVDVEATTTRVDIRKLSVTNPSLQRAIADKCAAFVLTYRCGATFLRASKHTFNDNITIDFSNGELAGHVALSLHVCAVKELRWCPEGLHQDYANASFTLPKGSVLALGPEFSFEVSDEFDPPSGSVTSLFTCIRASEKTASARIRFESNEKIQIILSGSEHDAFNKARAHFPAFVQSSLAYPALVEAITRLRNPQDGDDDKVWFRRLSEILSLKDCEDCDSFAAASKVLNRPFERSTRELFRDRTTEEEE